MKTYYDHNKRRRMRAVAGEGCDHWSEYCRKGDEFCCSCHWGEENRLIMSLAGLTWGYDVAYDMMRFGPSHHPPSEFEPWYTIEQFSEKTPEQLRGHLNSMLDQRVRLKKQ